MGRGKRPDDEDSSTAGEEGPESKEEESESGEEEEDEGDEEGEVQESHDDVEEEEDGGRSDDSRKRRSRRKRRRSELDEEEEEEENSEEEEEDDRRHRRRHHKKHKKHKKGKKSKKHRRRRSRSHEGGSSRRHGRRSRSGDEEEEEEEDASSEEERESRHRRRHRHKRHKRSRRETEEEESAEDTEKEVVEVDDGDEEEAEESDGTDRQGGSTPELPDEDEEAPVELEKEPVAVIDVDADATERDRRRQKERDREERSTRRDRSRSRERRRRDDDERRGRHWDQRDRSKERRRDRERSRSPQADKRSSRPTEAPPVAAAPVATESAQQSEAGVISLSVEETNALREKLGLKPLKLNDGSQKQERSASEEREQKRREENAAKEGGTLIPNSANHEVHKPATNIGQKSLADKMRERLAERRKKREMETKLLATKGLGDSDSDDADKWVRKQKKVAKEKRRAAKAAKAFEALDDEFGIGNLVEEDAKKERQAEYSRRDLQGLKVEHASDAFAEGRSVVLTLKDADVLDEEASDTLVNVNIADDERTRKRVDDIKKFKAGYNAYDNEEVDEMTGEVKRKNMLDKYDETIVGEQKDSFVIGRSGQFNEEEEKMREKERIKEKLKAKRLESLELPALKLASDYMTAEEASAKFKKTKKKKKVKRRALRADDLLPQDGMDGIAAHGSRTKPKTEVGGGGGASSGFVRGAMPMDLDDDNDGDIKPDDIDLANVKVDDEDDMGLELALKKARRLKQKSEVQPEKRDTADLILAEPKEEQREEQELTGSEFIATFEDQQGVGGSGLILNETAEFCRNLGARQMNEMAERRDRIKEEVAPDILEFEDSLKSKATKLHEAERRKKKRQQRLEEQRRQQRGGWSAVKTAGGDDDDDDIDDETIRREMAEAGGGDDNDDDEEMEEEDGYGEGPSTSSGVLGDEPNLQTGVAAAIQLASSKGYWETQERKAKSSNLDHLQAKNYAIDDKMMRGGADEDRSRLRDRFSGGPTMPFQEKEGFVPNVKLEYIDDGGRRLSTKEAFRFLSHKFHGKGSGKIKTEKRMKKVAEESMMQNMSSTDTPLQTLEKLKKKQRDNALPYLVMSGSQAGTNLSDLRK